MSYPFGTTGPKEADAFYEKYGINPATTWENLLLSNAKDAQQLKQLFDTFAKDKEALHHDEVSLRAFQMFVK